MPLDDESVRLNGPLLIREMMKYLLVVFISFLINVGYILKIDGKLIVEIVNYRKSRNKTE